MSPQSAFRRIGLALLGLLLGLGAAVLLPTGRVAAATFTVNTLGDTGAGAGTSGDLRYAITNAGSGDTINFSVTGTINLTSPLPNLSRDVSIVGPGANLLTVSGGGTVRVFAVDSGVTADLSNLTIANGSASIGGGIFNFGGTLTITNSTLSGNTAPGGDGGGIFNQGTLTVTNSTFADNTASLYGGGILSFTTLTVTNSTFSGNTAVQGGGGIENQGPLTVTNSTFSGNRTTSGFGGAIYNAGGTLTMTNGTVSGNTAPNSDRGGVFNQSTLNLTNTIISGNAGGDLYGSLAVNSHNRVGGPSLLASFANYGGPTQTFALLPGSLAIGMGDATVCANTSGSCRK